MLKLSNDKVLAIYIDFKSTGTITARPKVCGCKASLCNLIEFFDFLPKRSPDYLSEYFTMVTEVLQGN